MKRLLFMIPNLAHGGAERVLVNLVNNLDREKYEVTVQTLFDVGVNRQYLAEHIHYIPGFKKQFRGNSHVLKLFSPEFLYRRLIRGQYDIVVSYLEGPTARIVSGCTDPAVKKVGWLHTEMVTPKRAALGFRTVKESRSAYNNFDRLIAVSQRVQTTFLKSLSIRTPMNILYNTSESAQIIGKSSEKGINVNFIEDKVPSICSVGKIITVKGFDRLLSAHRRLLNEGLRHRVYLLGIGELENTLKKRAKELRVEDSFIFLGFQDNPYQYVAKCDLYVCSSRREGFSTAVTEALILGTPVVSTDCSGARELLGDHDEYGLVVENSEEGIYQGMKRMLSDPALLAHYREQARLRGGRFSKERTVQAVEEMFDGL